MKHSGTGEKQGNKTKRERHASWRNRIGQMGNTEGGSLTREGSSGSGVRGEPSGVEGQL